MNKEKFINKISERTGLKPKKGEQLFQRIFELISKELRKGKIVSLDGFGSFAIRRERLKVLINEKDKIVIPPKDLIEFAASESVIEKINSQKSNG